MKNNNKNNNSYIKKPYLDNINSKSVIPKITGHICFIRTYKKNN